MRDQPSQIARVFTWSISAAGMLALAYSIYRLCLEPVPTGRMACLVLMVLLTWRAEVSIPGVRSKVSLSDAFIYLGALLLGPWAAAILATLDALAKSPRGAKRASTVGINIAAMNLAILSGSLLAEQFFGPLDQLVSAGTGSPVCLAWGCLRS